MKINKKKLAIILDNLEKVDNPKVALEQYCLSGEIASDILIRAYLEGDIEDKVIVDQGTGNGIIAIGAYLLNARSVTGVDIDMESLYVAKRNGKINHSLINFVKADVSTVSFRSIDCVIENPPFGSQKKGADRLFISKAMELSDTIYSIHNFKGYDFVTKYVRELGGIINWNQKYTLPIPYMYKFHSKKVEYIDIVACKITKN
ncbi:MAG: METTL5 family protein [Candidatus Thermoplasmatota archaeon]|jgi:putative methylase|nr:METTL5 family protein [Candidatus Thermoplasmatota archaeon]